MPFAPEGLTVDRAGSGPLYRQIADAIGHQIAGHTLLPGEALPSEAELQRVFGVARSVVRQALACLVERDLVQRSQGRISIVAPSRSWRRQVQRAGGLERQLASAGQTLSTRVLSVASTALPASAQQELGTDRGWLIERVRSVDGTPVVFVRNWVPVTVFDSLDVADLTDRSLHDLMRSVGHSPVGGRRHVQAVPADDLLAELLEVKNGDALLLLTGVTRDAEGHGLEWFSVWHRGQTVFDVDADVRPAVPEAALDLLRSTAKDLRDRLEELNRQLRAFD